MTSTVIAGCSGAIRDAYSSAPIFKGGHSAIGSPSMAVIGINDRIVPYLASKLDRFYPMDLVRLLIRKDKMPELLEGHGFAKLDTARVSSIKDIKLRNFIIKPILGAGSKSMDGFNSDLSNRKFSDVSELLDKFSPDAIERDLSRGFVVQQAVMGDEHTTASVGGTVNSRGEVMFVRSAISTWHGEFRVHSIRGHHLASLDETKTLLRAFIDKMNIRNTAFSLQLLLLGDKFYPMDWNFHLAAPYVFDAMRSQPGEFYAAVHHMMDSNEFNFTPPTDNWHINRVDKSNGVDGETYNKNVLKVV
jgi:hypothetical protein